MVGFYIVSAIVAVSVIGMGCLIMDIIYTKEEEVYTIPKQIVVYKQHSLIDDYEDTYLNDEYQIVDEQEES